MVKKTEKPPFGIESMEIVKFRNFKEMTIPLGSRLTVIAGQNGTGKSTLLGMLGQPFGLVDAKDIFGRSMRTKFTDILKMSPEHDKPGEHLYYVNLRDETLYAEGETHVQVKSYGRADYQKLPLRLVTGRTRHAGEGNVDYPVIYLGMRRTYPVGEIKNPKSADAELTEEERRVFSRWYSTVFFDWDGAQISPVRLQSDVGRKSTILVDSKDYDHLSNSAGQDSLGQILASLISFERISEKMGDAYKGGLLLIDELDATLFPASQEELLAILWDEAERLRIQVAFTTHSPSLIREAMSYQRKEKGSIEVVYLRRRSSGISRIPAPDMSDIEVDLSLRQQERAPSRKAEVWCEDAEAGWLLRKMLPKKLSSKIKVVEIGLGCGELAELSVRSPSDLLGLVTFVVDGDGVKTKASRILNSKRLLFLPTGELSPEEHIYRMLKGLSDEDAFWTEGYSKAMFQRDFHDLEREVYGDRADVYAHGKGNMDKRVFFKKWFKREKQAGKWGTGGNRIYQRWKENNETEIEAFIEQLDGLVSAAIRRAEAMASGQYQRND